jgi:5'-3' exonuclease
MEADDLIYAFCTLNRDPTIIVSSDQDLRQITYRMENTAIYNPLAKKQQVENRPKEDVVLIKSLMGDASDNIGGYYNIGPKRAAVLASDLKLRDEFFKSKKAIIMVDGQPKVVGNEIFKRNRRMIDLSWCPEIGANCEYVEEKQMAPIQFDQRKVEAIIRKNKVRGLLADTSRYVLPFSKLGAT